MLTYWTNHTSFTDKLKSAIQDLGENDKNRLFNLYRNSLDKLSRLNLDNLLPLVSPLYAYCGRPAKHQCEIIRSLVLMVDRGVHSITKWVEMTANDILLQILCGFFNGAVPKVASYYDMLERLWQAPRKKKQVFKLRKFKRKPSKKYKSGVKMPNRKAGVVRRLSNALMSSSLPDIRPERVLQEILKHAVVLESANLGLIGDTNKLSLSGDGSPYYSGGNPVGVKVCKCKENRVLNCDCPRMYADIDASWGWDSYRERYFFGDTLYSLTAADSHNDLPIYLASAQASRHDGVSTVFAIRNVLNIYPEFTIDKFIADGAMDEQPLYQLLNHLHIRPFIPLDKNTKFPVLENYPQIKSWDDGAPICNAGFKWTNWGHDSNKNRTKYRCPFSAKHEAIPDCEACKACNRASSTYGASFYIKSADDPRLFTPVPRGTQSFRDTMKKRTGVERTFKRIFEDYNVEAYCSRSRSIRFSLAIFAAINMHLDAWLLQSRNAEAQSAAG